MKMPSMLMTALCLTLSLLSAESLKSSLMQTEKEKPAVDLDRLDVGKKAPVMPKSRPGDTLIGMVNDLPILKKRADAFLLKASQGKISDYDRLPKSKQRELLKSLAVTTLIEHRAANEVSEKEKNQLAARYWIGQQMQKIEVTKEEMRAFYDQNKKMFVDKKRETIPFEKVQDYIERAVGQQKFNEALMKDAKVVAK
jgi:hypothetical protein